MGKLSHLDPVIISFENYMWSIFKATLKHYLLLEYYANEDSALIGITGKVFGFDEGSYTVSCEADLISFTDEQLDFAYKKFEEMPIFGTCAALYQYAIDGIRPEDSKYGVMDDHWIGMIQDSVVFLQTIDSDFSKVSENILVIPELAMLRFGMDGDLDDDVMFSDFEPTKLIALLAKLDERTVRNAQAQGLFKDEYGDLSYRAIKFWLSTKKGFVKTKGLVSETTDKSLSEARNPIDLGEILKSQRLKLGKQFDSKVFVSKHHSFSKNTIEQIENGVFQLPLSTVRIIATHYELDEKELLEAIMRIFYIDELKLLRG